MVWRERFRPLPVELWLRELDRLSVWCEHEASQVDERAVRRAFHLGTLAPLGISGILAPTIALAELDALLDEGAIEQAARAAIGTDASIEVTSLPERGRWVAVFGLGDDAPVRCEAPTAVRAMIGAWATFLTKAAD